jgi:hypothetical protein
MLYDYIDSFRPAEEAEQEKETVATGKADEGAGGVDDEESRLRKKARLAREAQLTQEQLT